MENEATAASTRNPSDLTVCLEKIQRAINQHDLDALAECFDPDYRSTFPAHLGRAFRGHGQLRTNWSQIFSAVPDIHAELLRSAENGDTVWAEWEWRGTHVDGAPFLLVGVTIQGVQEGRVVWGRLYMEQVEIDGGAADAATALSLTKERPNKALHDVGALRGGE